MNRAEHIAEAERLLDRVAQSGAVGVSAGQYIAQAQVHATLALAMPEDVSKRPGWTPCNDCDGTGYIPPDGPENACERCPHSFQRHSAGGCDECGCSLPHGGR